MTTVQIGYLKDSTVSLLNVFADESEGNCEFVFGDMKVAYFTSPNFDGARWVAYLSGVIIMRAYTFEHLAMFLNSMCRSYMGYCVLIDCRIESH